MLKGKGSYLDPLPSYFATMSFQNTVSASAWSTIGIVIPIANPSTNRLPIVVNNIISPPFFIIVSDFGARL